MIRRTRRAGTGRPDPARSAVMLMASSLGVGVLSLWNVLVTSRGLGVEGRGQVAFLLTVGSLTAHLATLGVQEANGNFAGRSPQRTPALAGNSVVLALLLGGFAAALLLGLVQLAPALGGTSEPWLLWLVVGMLPVLVLHHFLQQLALAHYRFGVLSAAGLLTPVLNAVVNTALALTGTLTVVAAVSIWLLGQALSTLLYGVVVGRSLGGFGRPDAGLARTSLGFGARAHVGRTLTWGSYRLDQWVLGVLGSDRMLGLYSVAVAWAEVLFLIPQVLHTVLRPDLVRAERDEARRRTALVMRLGLLLTLPAAGVVVVMAPFLCVTLLGEEFRGAVTPLRVLTLGSVGVLALKIYGTAMLSRGRPLLDSAAVAPALVVMLVLDVLLIPAAGVLGAALASTLGYGVGGAVAVLLGMRVLGGRVVELVPRPADVRELVRHARWLRHRAAPASSSEELPVA